MYLKINEQIEIDLPEDLDIEDRKKLCQEIIDKYPDYFNYTLPTSKNDKHGENVQRKLNILASYLYKCVKDTKTDNILTEYREKRNNKREIKLSTIDYINIY